MAMRTDTKKMNIKTLNGRLGAGRPKMILKIDPNISTVIGEIIVDGMVKLDSGKKIHVAQSIGAASGRPAH